MEITIFPLLLVTRQDSNDGNVNIQPFLSISYNVLSYPNHFTCLTVTVCHSSILFAIEVLHLLHTYTYLLVFSIFMKSFQLYLHNCIFF